MYGMSAFGLAKQLGISRGEAQEYTDLYFDRYPGVKQYMEDIRLTASEKGYVETVFGRRLYLPEINARNAQRRQYAERSAINAPMQGTAADIIKRAMISVHAWLQEERPGARMIMQVHDELVFEVEDGKVDAVTATVTELMNGAATGMKLTRAREWRGEYIPEHASRVPSTPCRSVRVPVRLWIRGCIPHAAPTSGAH
jgi:DNA polymerase-1